MGIVDDVTSYVASFTGEVLTSGTVTVFTFPEYLMDSISQWKNPVTDPFLIAVPAGSQYAETHNLSFTFGGVSGRFWIEGVDNSDNQRWTPALIPTTGTETFNGQFSFAYAGQGELTGTYAYENLFTLVTD